MDTHYFKTFESYKNEFKLYEGLIYSRDLSTVERILKNKYNVTTNYKLNTLFIKHIFSKNVNLAKTQLNEVLTITNNLGWFPVRISSKNNTEYKDDIYNLEKFIEYIKTSFFEILISFEAKYDIPVHDYPRFLYHVCNIRSADKIIKQGLVPKSRSKKAYHPERVYLTKTKKDAYFIAQQFVIKGEKDFAILKIDTNYISEYLQLFKDPNFNERGYYTLNTITPYCISIDEIINF